MNTRDRKTKNLKSATAVRFGLAFGVLGACLIVDAVLGAAHASAGVLFGIAAAGVVVGGSAALVLGRRLNTALAYNIQRQDAIRVAFEENLKHGLKALASGDLTVHLEAKTKAIEPDQHRDDLGELSRATEAIRALFLDCYLDYNRATEKLRDLVARVSATASAVGDSSGQMAATSDETGKATAEVTHAIEQVAQGAERQVQMIDTARRAAGEVASAITESAQQAEQTAEVAGRARETAQQGVAAAEQADSAMRSVRDSSEAVGKAIQELSDKSGQIDGIVQTITGIAEQTNLLALNAAIEAARAGEQGRGFAVVAEEVRKLAEESEKAAEQISRLITAIQHDTAAAVDVVKDGAKNTANGTLVVEQARNAFLTIVDAVEDMNNARRANRRRDPADNRRHEHDAGKHLRGGDGGRGVLRLERAGVGVDGGDDRVNRGGGGQRCRDGRQRRRAASTGWQLPVGARYRRRITGGGDSRRARGARGMEREAPPSDRDRRLPDIGRPSPPR